MGTEVRKLNRSSFMRWDDDAQVRIDRVRFGAWGFWTYSYVTRSTVGVFPGIDSPDWIEVVW